MPESKALAKQDIKALQVQKNNVLDFLKEAMDEGLDYGTIPGTSGKSLFQPGADKLAKFLKLSPEFATESAIENFEQGFFYYRMKCTLRTPDGQMAGEAIKVCHSKEKKYRSLSTEAVLDKVNTIISMAEKRAFVAAVKRAAMASEIFKESYEVDEVTGEVLSLEEPEENEISLALKRLFAATSERGFLSEKVKETAYVKFQVDSMTKLNISQIEAMYSYYIDTFAPVSKGQSVKRIKPLEVAASPEPPSKPVPDTPTTEVGQVTKHEGEVLESPKYKKCVKCHQDKPVNDFHNGAFCNDCYALLPQNHKQMEAL